MTTAESATPVASDKPTDIRVLLKDLQARFDVFRNYSPLAIGIDKQVLAAQPDLDRKALRTALRMHVGSLRYMKAMEKATQRFDLEGKAVAEVSEEHRAHATETLKERFRKQAEEKRAKAAAEREAQAEAQAEARRTEKLQQLAARFSKR